MSNLLQYLCISLFNLIKIIIILLNEIVLSILVNELLLQINILYYYK